MTSVFAIIVYTLMLLSSDYYVCCARSRARAEPAIFQAVKDGNVSAVEDEIRRGVDVNIKNEQLTTPLLVAVEYGHEKIIEILVLNNANVNIEDDYKNTPLLRAVDLGRERIVEFLINKGADVNSQNKDRRSALMIAAEKGNEKIADILIQNDANINAINIYKETALHYSAQNGHDKVAELLLQNGAHVDAVEGLKRTPLHFAALYGHGNVADVLIRNGANVSAEDNRHRTASSYAAENGFIEIIKIPKKEQTANQPSQTIIRPAQQACQELEARPPNLLGNRILNGEAAELGEYPWMVALGYVSDHRGDDYEITFDCGGTIVSDFFILTAAHCVKPNREPTIVRMGTINLNRTEGITPYSRRIKNIIRHPSYSIFTEKNDIALIKLRRKIVFTRYISPACLQINLRDESTDVAMIVTGWGTTSAQEFQRTNELFKTQLKTMTLAECNRVLLDFNKRPNLTAFRDGIHESQYCALDPEGQRDSCQGDSGGPMQIFADPNSGIATVVGIVSFGVGCGSSTIPGIYTRVAYYLDWIEEKVWPNRSTVYQNSITNLDQLYLEVINGKLP